MKIALLFSMGVLAVAGAGAQKDGAEKRTERAVTVCIDFDANPAIRQAKVAASGIFARIGVRLNWRSPDFCPAGSDQTIPMHVNNIDGRLPGSFAVSSPHGGLHIEVFYERVRRSIEPQAVTAILAHVFAHEIAHIIQGTGGHSKSGVMKAHWDNADYALMTWKPLQFTEDDIVLIHRRLDLWLAVRQGKLP